MSHHHSSVHASSMSVRERRRQADCKKMAYRRAIEERAEARRLALAIDGSAAFMLPVRGFVPVAAGC